MGQTPPPPKQRGTPAESTLQTSLWPSQQATLALGTLTVPPSGSLPEPQTLPVGSQELPLSQRPALQVTLEMVPLPQQMALPVQKLPVTLQPVNGWHPRPP